MSQITNTDYLLLTLIIFGIFAALLVIGNFGNLFEPLSPQTIQINRLYQFVYISGSAVGAIFLGALLFMLYKFRETS
ncbi:MAG: respiratory chain protein (SoxI-like) [Candidatus Caldarchaeum sp.]|nr:respiratory chain protein (SoxI-like) [Candidatus Caldarchaeum sp.]